MLGLGTTVRMTSHADNVKVTSNCNMFISLGDNSKIHSSEKGTRSVCWQRIDGSVRVSLRDTLVAPEIAENLLSIAALTREDVAVLFLPQRAILFDLKDYNSILGYASQDFDGLYYIADDQNDDSHHCTDDEIPIHTMMEVVRNNETNIISDEGTETESGCESEDSENSSAETGTESNLSNNSTEVNLSIQMKITQQMKLHGISASVIH